VVKRTVDLIAAVLGLLVLAPLLVVIAVLVKREDRGPVLYRGVRIGRHGRPFRMCKFRTMVVNAERLGGSSTADDDPRITRIGGALRRYKLDELPQLFNVVAGHMSLVGPRPEVEAYVRMFSPERRILDVRPGITDWATLSNPDEGALLRGRVDPERAYLEEIRPQKMRLQLEYVSRHSLAVDLLILGATVRHVISRVVRRLVANAGIPERQGAPPHAR
jgi:lipopolysaccharide/colanic/teichoic acid biosynthesis glycosyltransferase